MGMIVDHPTDYFSQWIPMRSGLLKDLEKEAHVDEIPIVGPVVGQLLFVLATAAGARRIIELGTATGYSAIYLGNACRSTEGRLTTFEADPRMALRAEENIDKAGLSRWVRVECRDALDGLRMLTSPVDMVFLDIEKEDYVRALSLCGDNLRTGGMLVADNTSFKNAHEFNRMIFDHPHWASVNLWSFLPGHSPDHDGLCIAIKKA